MTSCGRYCFCISVLYGLPSLIILACCVACASQQTSHVHMLADCNTICLQSTNLDVGNDEGARGDEQRQTTALAALLIAHQQDVLVLDLDVLRAADALQHVAALLQEAALDKGVGRLGQQQAT